MPWRGPWVPTALWLLFPDERLTWLPFSVAMIYLATVGAILVDSARVRRRLGMA